jgi:tetratricopeptide (TPR) repeat protein
MLPSIRTHLLFFAISVAAGLAGSSAAYATGPAEDSCLSESSAPDSRIAACTALIRSQLRAAKNSGVARVEASMLLSRAAAFGQKGKYAHAIADITRVLNLAPSPAAYYTRALAYHNIGENNRAIADCNAALQIDPGDANALFVRAASHQGKADYTKAIRDYTEVLQLEPDRADALFSRGAAHYSSGQYDRAVDDFTRTIDLGAADGNVFYLRSLAYQELGRTANANADMTEALRRDPDLQERPPVRRWPTTTGQR